MGTVSNTGNNERERDRESEREREREDTWCCERAEGLSDSIRP
jgi:hypothetical protein